MLLHHPDEAIRTAISRTLSQDQLEVISVADGREAQQVLNAGSFQVIILSASSAGITGLDLLKRIRGNPAWESIPVLVLAEGPDYERIVSLELGADDCILAPFVGREVALRVRSLLRRSNCLPKQVIIQTPQFHFDPVAHDVRVLGNPVRLTGTEFKLLSMLIKKPGLVVEKRELTKALSGSSGQALDYKTINTHMRRLRGKLGPLGEQLQSIRGIGYRLTWKSESDLSSDSSPA